MEFTIYWYIQSIFIIGSRRLSLRGFTVILTTCIIQVEFFTQLATLLFSCCSLTRVCCRKHSPSHMAMCQEIRKRSMMQLLAVAVVLLSLSVMESTHAEKIDLMQYHHCKSPYATPNLSLTDRILIAAKSSRERAAILSKSKNSTFEEPVFSAQGSYIMEVQLGSPPQTKVAIADTGSDLFWLECQCTSGSCFPEPDAPFDPKKSSTYSLAKCTDPICTGLPQVSCGSSGECDYNYGYGDGSTTQGVLASDVFTLGSSTFPVEFGCGQQNQGTFNNTDGLVGLGRGPASIITQIGSNFGNVFSYCLVSFYDSQKQTSPLYLGASASGDSNYTYTPLLNTDPTFYEVTLNGLLVNGHPVVIPPGSFSSGFILDSGTTITQLQTGGYTPLLTAVKKLIKYTPVDGQQYGGFDACYAPDVSTPKWPEVTFQFDGVDVALPEANLFLLVDDTTTAVYCMAIMGSSQGFGIFGNVQQQNFNIEYDVGNMQVGFSGPTTC